MSSPDSLPDSLPDSGAPQAAAPTSGARRNRLRGPLIASLILNLFLIGAAGGGWIFGGHRGPPPGGGGGAGGGEIGRWFSNLPESRREDLKSLFDSKRDARRARRGEIHAAREAAIAALEARPFAPAALEQAWSVIHDQGEELSLEAHRDLLTIVGRMTDAEREAFAKQLRRPPRHGGQEPPPPPKD